MAETNPRARLGEAIARYGEAAGYVRKIVGLKSRLGDQHITTWRARDAAERHLNATRREAPGALVASLLADGDDDDGAAVRQAEVALAAAEAAHERVERQQQALAEEENEARSALSFAEGARNDAVATVLRAAPSVSSLLASLHEARRRVKTIEGALSVMPATVLPNHWGATSELDEVPDPVLAERWRSAVAALQLDAAAELPPPTISRIERVVVYPKQPAAA